jgi:hypothetical protein
MRPGGICTLCLSPRADPGLSQWNGVIATPRSETSVPAFASPPMTTPSWSSNAYRLLSTTAARESLVSSGTAINTGAAVSSSLAPPS